MSGTLQASIVKDSASSTSNLTLDTSGNVTVGNNLTVTGSTTVSATSIGNLTYTGTLTGSTGILNIGSGQIYKDASGNVGIGTSSPKTRLQSTAATTLNAPSLGSATSAPFYVTNSDTAYGLLVGTTASDGHVWLQAQRTDGTATAYNITLNEAGGNVGIGTSSPSSYGILAIQKNSTTAPPYVVLQNVGTNAADTSTYTQGGVLFSAFRDVSNPAYIASITVERSSASSGASSAGAIIFGTASTSVNPSTSVPAERIRIDSSGNLLVGTTTSSAKLTAFGGGTGPTEYLKQTTAGSYVSIIDAVINGATYYLVSFNAAGTQTGSISSNGTLTTYGASSDIRLKENIVDAPSALPTLAKLQVRSFDWKSGPHHKFGFIAQEVVEVDPNAVAKGPTEDDMWAIDNSVLVPMLIKAVQELSAKNDALEARLAALEAK